MFFSNLYKQLKRRLRLRKRWLSLGMFVLVAAGLAVGVVWLKDERSGDSPVRGVWAPESDLTLHSQTEQASEAALAAIASSKDKREVILLRRYVCGEETEVLGQRSPGEIESLYRERSAQGPVELSINEKGQAVLLEVVEELGPRCRENAYFGMDKSGNLSLFDGLPDHDKVIRTFFQLDVEHLRSSLPEETVKQLYSGIHVSDVADYNSVLSTFSEYAAEDTTPVVNPTIPKNEP